MESTKGRTLHLSDGAFLVVYLTLQLISLALQLLSLVLQLVSLALQLVPLGCHRAALTV